MSNNSIGCNTINQKNNECLNCGSKECVNAWVANGVVSFWICRNCARELYKVVVNAIKDKPQNRISQRI